mmetsp:Transcript_46528/g.92173  ORF Transcript_46528/g.92173 Transcript_46528/m.92173 type:complete len:113 (+) Transcript_46528:163-501(+)
MDTKTEPGFAEEVDVTDVLQAAKMQYNGDKVYHMTRRMSGMPLLHRLNKSYVSLDDAQAKRFNDLLDKFPDPPATSQCPPSGSQIPSQNKSSTGGWGSIGRLAEKFNMFNKA